LERKDCVDERQFDTLTRGCAVTVTHKNAEAASIASMGTETDDAKLRATFRNGKMIIWRALSCGAVKIRSVDPTISPGFDFDFQLFFCFSWAWMGEDYGCDADDILLSLSISISISKIRNQIRNKAHRAEAIQNSTVRRIGFYAQAAGLDNMLYSRYLSR
jgi:hypothetical protein